MTGDLQPVTMATGSSPEGFISGYMSSVLDWFWFELLLSPQDSGGTAAMLALGEKKSMGRALDLPS